MSTPNPVPNKIELAEKKRILLMNRDAKRILTDKKRNAVLKRIAQTESQIRKLSYHGRFKEYWRLALYLIEHNKKKEGIKYMQEAIAYKEHSEHCCVYHQLGVLNKYI